MNVVKLSVNQWTSIFTPSSLVWLNTTCTLTVADGGQRSATLLSRTPWRWHTASPTTTRQQLKISRSLPDIPTLPVCLFSHHPNQVVTRWWSADSSAPTFTHVSRIYSCRSDGMTTKSWCHMQIWTPLFFNTVFNVWLAQRSNNRTPLGFTLGRFSHSNLSRSHCRCSHKCWSPSAERWSTLHEDALSCCLAHRHKHQFHVASLCLLFRFFRFYFAQSHHQLKEGLEFSISRGLRLHKAGGWLLRFLQTA